MLSPKKLTARFAQIVKTIARLDRRFDELRITMEETRINQGIVLSTLNRNKTSTNLRDFEFRVFSQWGEDGIIQHLVNTIAMKHRTFIEFGVEDFAESNCRFLLMKDNWRGFVVDGSAANITRLRHSYFYWKYHLEARAEFITAENINALLAQSGFDEDLGILSVDIDGNDYHVLNAITQYKPRILICEYNAVFGPRRSISVPYDPGFYRTRKHYSNLYYGCSLAALTSLAARKCYSLVGTNSMGSNAFFVRNDLLDDRMQVLTAEEAYIPSNIRESRDRDGGLSYLTGDDRLMAIRDMPVLNVETNAIEKL